MLALLEEAGVKLKLKKCFFFHQRFEYLGNVITPGRLSVANDAEATCSVREASFPQSITQLRRFLGACNVYRRFVKDYSKIASPLSDMLRKNTCKDWHNPTKEQLRSFEDLKARLTVPPTLALPKANRSYLINTDASAYAIGAVLLQQQDKDDPTSWATVGYWSKTLTNDQRNYSATERECYAVVRATLSLTPYIEGTKFVVRTDHNALRWMMTTNDPRGRLMRWRLRLMEFDYEIVYRPGRVHQVPEALSRLLRKVVPKTTRQSMKRFPPSETSTKYNPNRLTPCNLSLARGPARRHQPARPTPRTKDNPPQERSD